MQVLKTTSPKRSGEGGEVGAPIQVPEKAAPDSRTSRPSLPSLRWLRATSVARQLGDQLAVEVDHPAPGEGGQDGALQRFAPEGGVGPQREPGLGARGPALVGVEPGEGGRLLGPDPVA